MKETLFLAKSSLSYLKINYHDYWSTGLSKISVDKGRLINNSVL